MCESRSPVRKTLAFLVFFGVVSLNGACGSASTEADTGGEAQFTPWEKTMALNSPFPGFIFLPLNNPGVVPVELASHMKDDDIVAGGHG